MNPFVLASQRRESELGAVQAKTKERPFNWSNTTSTFAPVGGTADLAAAQEADKLARAVAFDANIPAEQKTFFIEHLTKKALEKSVEQRNSNYEKNFKLWLLGNHKALNDKRVTPFGHDSVRHIPGGESAFNFALQQINTMTEVKRFMMKLYLRGPQSQKEIEYYYRYLVAPINDRMQEQGIDVEEEDDPVEALLTSLSDGKDARVLMVDGVGMNAKQIHDTETPLPLNPLVNLYLNDEVSTEYWSVNWEDWNSYEDGSMDKTKRFPWIGQSVHGDGYDPAVEGVKERHPGFPLHDNLGDTLDTLRGEGAGGDGDDADRKEDVHSELSATLQGSPAPSPNRGSQVRRRPDPGWGSQVRRRFAAMNDQAGAGASADESMFESADEASFQERGEAESPRTSHISDHDAYLAASSHPHAGVMRAQMESMSSDIKKQFGRLASSVAKERDTMLRSLQSQQRAMDAAAAALGALTKEQRVTSERVDDLASAMQAMSGDINRLSGDVRVAAVDRKAALRELKEVHEQSTKGHADQIAELRDTIQNRTFPDIEDRLLHSTKKACREECEKILSEVQTLREEFQASKGALSKEDAEALGERMRGIVNKWHEANTGEEEGDDAEKKAMQEQISALQGDIEEREEAMRSAGTALVESEMARGELKKQLDAKQAEIDEAESKLASAKEKLVEPPPPPPDDEPGMAKIEEEGKQLEELREKLKETESERDKLQKKAGAAELLRNKLAKLRGEMKELKQFEEQAKSSEVLRKTVADLKSELEEKKRAYDKLAAAKGVEDLEKEWEELNKRAAEQAKEYEAMAKSEQDTLRAARALSVEFVEKSKEAEEAKNKATRLQGELAKARAAQDKMQKSAHSERDARAAKKAIQDLERQLGEAQLRANRAIRDAVAAAEEEKKAAILQIRDEALEEIETFKANHEKASRAEKAELAAKIDRLQSELEAKAAAHTIDDDADAASAHVGISEQQAKNDEIVRRALTTLRSAKDVRRTREERLALINEAGAFIKEHAAQLGQSAQALREVHSLMHMQHWRGRIEAAKSVREEGEKAMEGVQPAGAEPPAAQQARAAVLRVNEIGRGGALTDEARYVSTRAAR